MRPQARSATLAPVRLLRFLPLAGILLLGLVQPGRAAGVWRLATAEIPPSVGASLPGQGYYAVMLRRVLQELRVEAQIGFLPPRRAIEDTQAGRFDAVFPLLKNAERERDFLFAEPFFTARLRVFVARQDDWSGGGVETLRGQRFCNVNGVRFGEALQAEVDAGRVQVETVKDIDACFKLLGAGRVRFAITGEHTGWAAAQAHPLGLKGFRVAGPVLAELPAHLAFPRKLPESAARVEAFNQALKRLRAQGVMATLEQQLVPATP